MDANTTEGLFPIVIHTVNAVAGVLEDVVSEVRGACTGALDLAESISKGALRISRKLNDRGAELALDVIARGRMAGVGALALVGDASSLVVRSNGAPPIMPRPTRGTQASPSAS